jgi:hypothetical protein
MSSQSPSKTISINGRDITILLTAFAGFTLGVMVTELHQRASIPFKDRVVITTVKKADIVLIDLLIWYIANCDNIYQLSIITLLITTFGVEAISSYIYEKIIVPLNDIA